MSLASRQLVGRVQDTVALRQESDNLLRMKLVANECFE
jgi:hypothetical protein